MKRRLSGRHLNGIYRCAFPEINDDEVLIKVRFADLRFGLSIYTGKYAADKLPMFTGHEFWGEIAKVGKNARG
jgi:D-arabinose 1-dehydrogenase-like Zn-dependent alcohol dehydrogenase